MNPDQFYSYLIFEALLVLGALITLMGGISGIIKQLKRIADSDHAQIHITNRPRMPATGLSQPSLHELADKQKEKQDDA